MNRAIRQSGIGLIELMISITVGLLVMAGVIQLFASANQNSVTAEGASRIQENIRYALARIGDDIARAGNLGCHSFAARPNGYFTNDLVVAETWDDDFANNFIFGINDDPETGGDAAVLDETDTLLVRYADAASTLEITDVVSSSEFRFADASAVTTNDVVMAGTCSEAHLFQAVVNGNDISMANGTHTISTTESLAFLYTGNTGVHEYYIGGSSCAANAQVDCSLYRRTNGGAGEELVKGVHNMQVEYVIDGATTYHSSADLITNGLNLADIDRVRVTLDFNAEDVTQDGNLLTKTVRRTFSVRNQL